MCGEMVCSRKGTESSSRRSQGPLPWAGAFAGTRTAFHCLAVIRRWRLQVLSGVPWFMPNTDATDLRKSCPSLHREQIWVHINKVSRSRLLTLSAGWRLRDCPETFGRQKQLVCFILAFVSLLKVTVLLWCFWPFFSFARAHARKSLCCYCSAG